MTDPTTDHGPISLALLRENDAYTDLEVCVSDLAADLSRLDQASEPRAITEALQDLLSNAGMLAEAVEELVIAAQHTEPLCMGNSEALIWARAAAAGEYLARYDLTSDDTDSRCGYDAETLAGVEQVLARRGLTLTANDRGLAVTVSPT